MRPIFSVRAMMRSTLALVLGMGIAGNAAFGQVPPDTACAGAARVASRAAESSALRAAIARLQGCAGHVNVLATLWTSTGDTAVLATLAAVSGRVGNDALFAAVKAAARNEALPMPVRAHALAALATYVDPGITIDFRTRPGKSRPEVSVTRWTHDPGNADAKRITLRPQVLAVMDDAAQHDVNENIRAIAANLAGIVRSQTR